MSSDSMNADGRKLKSLVDDLHEKIRALRLFDRAGEINTHCDELVGQVTLAVESGIAHLNKLQADMIAEINSYRAELLVSGPLPRRISTGSGQEDPRQLERKLETLAKEVEAFSAECSANSDRSRLSSQVVQAASGLREKARHLRREMRAQSFASSFMWLMKSDSPIDGLVGRLERIQKDTEDDLSVSHIVLNDCVSQASAFELDPDTPVGFKHAMTAMLFLRDANIAIALERRPIVVWNPKTCQRIFELKKPNHPSESFTALVQASDQYLISGELGGSIDIWNLVNRCHVRSLSPMAGPVLSLDWLPEGKLVGFNGSVFVWNFNPADNRRYGLVRFNHPFYDYGGENIIRQTTNGFKLYEDIRIWNVNKQRRRSCLSKHQPLYKLSFESEARVHLEVNFRVLSNGFLVFSYVVPSGATVQVWDPQQDALVNDYEFTGDDVESCAILPSGDAVVCRLDQQVQLYSLLDGKLYRSFRNDKGPIVGISHQPSSSIIFFHVRDESDRARHLSRFGGSQQSSSNSFHVCFSASESHLALVNNKTKKLAIWSLNKQN